ncbi:MAG: hypothetical protein ACOZCL_04490 [Bacillota bacterium]
MYTNRSDTCWYCSKPSRGNTEQVSMYKLISHDVKGKTHTFNCYKRIVHVPRCEKCKKLKSSSIVFAAIIGSIASILALVYDIFIKQHFFLVENIVLNRIFLTVLYFAMSFAVSSGIYILAAFRGSIFTRFSYLVKCWSTDYPEIEDLKKEGWKVGDSPSINNH